MVFCFKVGSFCLLRWNHVRNSHVLILKTLKQQWLVLNPTSTWISEKVVKLTVVHHPRHKTQRVGDLWECWVSVHKVFKWGSVHQCFHKSPKSKVVIVLKTKKQQTVWEFSQEPLRDAIITLTCGFKSTSKLWPWLSNEDYPFSTMNHVLTTRRLCITSPVHFIQQTLTSPCAGQADSNIHKAHEWERTTSNVPHREQTAAYKPKTFVHVW